MLKYYYLLLSILILGSCSLTDNEHPIPSYLVVNDVNIATTEIQGVPSHKISDLWVYADNSLIGVFELPIKIPIIVNEASTKFSIYPGIRNNGETARSFIYKLMGSQDFTLPLTPGEIVEKSLTFSYTENAIFDFVEGFESSGHIFTKDLDGNTETKIEIIDESAVGGIKSGKIKLDATNNHISVASIFEYQRKQNAGSDSYLEMDYKCDIAFIVGVIYVQEGKKIIQPLLEVKPKEEWNKLYVDYTEILTSPVLETYQIYFEAGIDPLTQATGEIYLDNLKFIHL